MVTLHPKLAPVHAARARILFELKRNDEALQEMNVALKLDAGNSNYYLARAAVLKRLGRDREALADTQKSCGMDNKLACMSLKRAAQGAR